MRKIFSLIILLMLLPCAGYAQTAANNVNLLFVVTAKTAVLKTNNDGSYRLTFVETSPYMTYFTNRPNRQQGLAAIQNFMKAWGVGANNFNTNPPNAIITATRINNVENNTQQFYIFTLTAPKYDQEQNVLQFIARPLAQKILFKDIRFDNATMVID